MGKRIQTIILSTVILACSLASCHTNTVKNSKTLSFGRISDDSLLTLTEYKTFMYFWDGAEPVSGMAPERIHIDGVYPENDKNIVTTGGSGFGIMSIIVAVER